MTGSSAMKITDAAFYTSAAALSGLPDLQIPEIVFAGRSNVGKSTLLNSLAGIKGLAKTSSTPGKTRLINFFQINKAFFFVDLPGYGFAAVGHEQHEAWKKLLTTYIERRAAITLVVLLIDSRHPAMQSDREMIDYLTYLGKPYGIVLTKDDKLTQSQRINARRVIENSALNAEFIVNYSSFSSKARLELLAYLAKYIR
jgi:GTP-binding protein